MECAGPLKGSGPTHKLGPRRTSCAASRRVRSPRARHNAAVCCNIALCVASTIVGNPECASENPWESRLSDRIIRAAPASGFSLPAADLCTFCMRHAAFLAAGGAAAGVLLGRAGQSRANGHPALLVAQSAPMPCIENLGADAELVQVQVVFRWAGRLPQRCPGHPGRRQQFPFPPLITCRHGARTPLTDKTYMWGDIQWDCCGQAYQARAQPPPRSTLPPCYPLARLPTFPPSRVTRPPAWAACEDSPV